MLIKSAVIFSRVTMLFFFMCLSVLVQAQNLEVNKTAAPSWVLDVKAVLPTPESIPDDQIKQGIYYLLLDRQLKVNDTDKIQVFQHYAEYIANQSGLTNSSQIDISYDPSYQSLSLHKLNIIRNHVVIDKLQTAKYSVLQREQDMERLLYDGRLSANIIVDDVRVGDIVEYSFTIEGSNPVYSGLFHYDFYTQWSVPVKYQHIRVLWGKSKPLLMRFFNKASEPKVKNYRDGKEFIFEVQDTVPLAINSQSPGWYDPYGEVVLTDRGNWSDIVNWALPLYMPAIESDADLIRIADHIRRENATASARIRAALEFVQSEIRYLGLEMGESSHKPSHAGETLARRYGDCKDKSVLLVALLNALDISAAPALVSSYRHKEILNYPPSAAAFDHVIVHVRHDNKDWWLDPTRQHQQATLETLYQPDFGYALILSSGVGELTPMTAVREVKQVVEDEFDLRHSRKGKTLFTTVTRYYGYEAERQRETFASSSNEEITEQYLNFYKKSYPEITPVNNMKLEDVTGEYLQMTEAYEIANLWEKDEDGDLQVHFSPHAISSSLVEVEEAKRSSPLYLRHPHHVKQVINILLPAKDWSFDDEVFTEKNEFFEYENIISFDSNNNRLTLTYEYKSLVNHVPVEDISHYIKALKKVDDVTGYNIYDIVEIDEAVGDVGFSSYLVLIVLVVIFIVLICFAVIDFFLDKKRKIYYDDSIFYPVSVWKLAILGFFTLGIYNHYWFYRNWSYVKRVDNNHIMPFWRSVFQYLWFFSIAARVLQGAEVKRKTVFPKSTLLLTLIALVYFISSLLSGSDYYSLPAFLIFMSIFLVFAYQVNQAVQHNEDAYQHHSRWRFRHYLLVVAFVPMLLVYFGEGLTIFSPTKIVSGVKLPQRNVDYMINNKMLDNNEKLIYFYSADFFNYRNDGNGLTENKVFSYWVDESGKINLEKAYFKDIEKIEFTDEQDWGENASLTIFREDGSNFVLHLANEDKLHHKFHGALKELWRNKRLQAEVDQYLPKASALNNIDYEKLRMAVIQIMNSALLENDKWSQERLAFLYSRGLLVTQSVDRALYFYKKAYDQEALSAGASLAWHYAVAARNQDELDAAVSIASDLLKKEDRSSYRETLAAAYAAMGDFGRAKTEQRRALVLANNADSVQMKLRAYEESQPWLQLYDSEMSPPVSISRAVPDYPVEALTKKITGKVTLVFDVSASGLINNIQVESSEPEGVFDEAAIAALQKSLYLPSIVKGESVDSKAIKTRFTFAL